MDPRPGPAHGQGRLIGSYALRADMSHQCWIAPRVALLGWTSGLHFPSALAHHCTSHPRSRVPVSHCLCLCTLFKFSHAQLSLSSNCLYLLSFVHATVFILILLFMLIVCPCLFYLFSLVLIKIILHLHFRYVTLIMKIGQ